MRLLVQSKVEAMMQCVYEPADLFEAQMLLGMLHNEGVWARLAGVDLLGAAGELPVLGLIRLLVDGTQAEHARQLIEAYNTAHPLDLDLSEGVPGILLC